MHIVFHRHKKSFLIIEMKLHHCITLQKNTEKTILHYITLTVSRGTYLGIDQRKHKGQICKQCRKHVEKPHV